jgi:maltose O-acetyltransferase
MTARSAGRQFRRMVGGELYDPADPELVALRGTARSLTHRFNHTPPDQGGTRSALLRELFSAVGPACTIEPTLHVDYGCNISVGERCYANANNVWLDVAPIRIGDDAMLGPGVQLLTATHPTDRAERTAGLELGLAITLGDAVWLGGAVIVCPGVTIGDGTVVGAGSVVVQSLPAGVVAVGNPARIVRRA